jgi:alpha-L-rhamnosidase
MSADRVGSRQSAYRIRIIDQKGHCAWDSGRVQSAKSVDIPYEGEKLKAQARYAVSLNVWNDRKQRQRDQHAWFETGLLDADAAMKDAAWIYAPEKQKNNDETAETQTSFDFQCNDSAAGILLGDPESIYDSYRVFQIDTSAEHPVLRTFMMNGFQSSDRSETDLSAYGFEDDMMNGTWHHADIFIQGFRIKVQIDGVEVAQLETDGRLPVMKTGLYHGRSSDVTFVDNLQIARTDGGKKQIIFDEKFDNEYHTSFAPAYVKVQNKAARLQAGVTLAGADDDPAPLFRKKFTLEGKKVISARLYATALGIYDIQVNGHEVSQNVLDPGESSYDSYVNYCTYDVSDLLQQGGNAIGVCLAHGWYDRACGTMDNYARFGTQDMFRAMLEITFADGKVQKLVTDGSWKDSLDGPVRADDFYQGERYDAAGEIPGWAEPAFDDSDWTDVAEADDTDTTSMGTKINALHLEARVNSPVEVAARIHPVSMSNPVPGVYVYDFGSQFTGNCQVKAKGTAGSTMTCRYAELLNARGLTDADGPEGTIWTDNLLTARDTDLYTFDSSGTGTMTPEFTWRSFRYLQITGVSNAPTLSDVTLQEFTSTPHQTMTFTSQNGNLNAMAFLSAQTMRCNSIEHPSDCPQRDERFGWTGDAQFYAGTAAYQADTVLFLQNYEKAIVAGQTKEGAYPDMAPANGGGSGNPGWGDAGVTVPWLLYTRYGDLQTLQKYLSSMCRYADYLISASDAFIYTKEDYNYGDFNAINETPKPLVHTAECYHVTDLVSKMAAAAGQKDLAAEYGKYAEQFRDAFVQKFIQPDGSMECWTQGAYAIALSYGLYPPQLQTSGAADLNTCVNSAGFHPGTGYATTPVLLQTLAENGYGASAYQMMNQTDAPSWLYPVSHFGATTMPENFEKYQSKADGTYQVQGSLNHPALASAASFLYDTVLGIHPDFTQKGFFRISPVTDPGTGEASGSYESVYGTISSGWKYMAENAGIEYTFSIPANTSAEIVLQVPGEDNGQRTDEAQAVTLNGKAISVCGSKDGLTGFDEDAQKLTAEVESGEYVIRVAGK